MIKAGFSAGPGEWPWHRQFPGGNPTWEDVEFIFDGDLSECDVVFLYGDTLASQADGLAVKRAVFVASEPWTFKTYRSRFLAQFDRVLTTDPDCRHPHAIFSQPGLPWHVGVFGEDGALRDQPMLYEDFRTYSPEKTKLISVVASDKAMTRGHRNRLEFVDKLKQHFGSEIDFYGRNVNGFGDKLEVLAEYRYHIAIENHVGPDYWTEKLSDPVLTLTYPIYAGCTNISDYFDKTSYTAIDMNDPDGAIATIRKVIDSDLAERAQPALGKARKAVLEEHNVFAVLAPIAKDACTEPERPRILLPERRFRRDLWRKIKSSFRTA